MLIIFHRVTSAPNIWTGHLKELCYEIAQLIETPYAGGLRYLAVVGFFKADVTKGG